jgi:hypothetical protein
MLGGHRLGNPASMWPETVEEDWKELTKPWEPHDRFRLMKFADSFAATLEERAICGFSRAISARKPL